MSDGGVEINMHPEGLALLFAEDGPVAKYVGDKGNKVLAAAQASCPVDTGQLKESLGVKVLHLAGGIEVWVGVREPANAREGSTATNAEVATYMEFGTSRGIQPTHFLSDALNAARD